MCPVVSREGYKEARNVGAGSRFEEEFEEWAATYDETVATGSDVFQGYEAVLDAVAAEVTAREGAAVADIGAGTGNLSARLCGRLRVTAVEPSAAMRAALTRKLPQVDVRAGDFLHLPEDLPPQDAIVATFSFHHVPPGQRRRSLRGLADALSPQGRLIMADVAFAGPRLRRSIFSELEGKDRSDLLRNLRVEFYPTVDVLLAAMHDAGFRASARQLTPWVWLFTAERGRLDLGLAERVPRPIQGLRAAEGEESHAH